MNMNNNHANKNVNEKRSIGKRNIVDCDDDFSYDDDDEEDNDHNDIVQNNKKEKSSSHSSKEELEIKYDAVLAVVGKFPNGTTKDSVPGTTRTTTRPNSTAAGENTLFQIAERKKKEKAQEYKIKNDFAKTMTMNHITWGKDSHGDTIIIDIGGCALANWNVQMLTTFCRRVGLTVRENSKRRSDCIRHILELHEPGMVRHEPLKNETNRSRSPKITAAAKTTVPHCVTTSILEKNQEAKAVFIVQQETEEVQKKKAKHEYQESLDQSFEALEQRIFETKMELRIITRKLLQTSDAIEVEDVTVHQEYLVKKLDRNEKNMKTLKIKIHNTQYI